MADNDADRCFAGARKLLSRIRGHCPDDLEARKLLELADDESISSDLFSSDTPRARLRGRKRIQRVKWV